jgi:mxaA protein
VSWLIHGARSRSRSRAVVLLLACFGCSLAAPAMAQSPDGSRPPNADVQEAPPESANGEPPKPALRPNATVEQPRAFGYVVGDVLTQRVLLNLNGREFVPAELPLPGRMGVWLERRSARVEKDTSGRRWLRVDYQLMNSPQELRVVTLPAWKLKPADGASDEQAGSGQPDSGRRAGEQGAGELRVGEWPISVAPLTPERSEARPGLGALRPDRVAPLIALAPMERGLRVGVAGLLVTVLAWAGWLLWRNWRASAAQPFAHAMSEMRTLDGTAPQAWYALHRAFDATAGRAVRTETLPELFRRAPHLEPLKAQIEEFFRESAKRFFAGAPIASTLSASTLCRELRRIEKRHER